MGGDLGARKTSQASSTAEVEDTGCQQLIEQQLTAPLETGAMPHDAGGSHEEEALSHDFPPALVLSLLLCPGAQREESISKEARPPQCKQEEEEY